MDSPRNPAHERPSKTGCIAYGAVFGINCVVSYLSVGGACLELERNTIIPDQFSLTIKPDIKIHRCKVIWRSEVTTLVRFLVGVRFF